MLDSLLAPQYPSCMDTSDTGSNSDELERYAQLLGERLRDLRRERKLSQEAVAQRAGISTFTYRKLEHGESNPGTPANPRLKTLLNLSRVFGVPVHNLLPLQISGS